MPDKSTQQADSPIEQQARQWVVRLTSGHAGPEDIAQARAWCALSAEHQQAFVEARRLWQLSGYLAPAQPGRRAFWRRRIPLAAAAVLLLAIGLAGVRQAGLDADYRTGVGEQRWFELADGSRLLLDSDSAVDVDYYATQRVLRLRKGQALFDVHPDVQRPFRVQAGDLQATALGTRYAVAREPSATRVLVEQGRVAVMAEGQVVELGQAQGVAWRPGGGLQAHAIDSGRALAWRDQRLVFEMTPLAEVVEVLERYRPGLMFIRDRQLSDLKVSGTFRLDRLDEGLATLEQVFPLQVKRYGRYLVVLQAR